jgi:hypothetical protein
VIGSPIFQAAVSPSLSDASSTWAACMGSGESTICEREPAFVWVPQIPLHESAPSLRPEVTL